MDGRKNISIIIDSSGSEVIRVVLETADKKRFELKKSVFQAKAQEVLPMIEEVLVAQKIALNDVTGIRVNTGPGSYTGLRVGIAIINMLGALLGVPVNDLPIGKTVSPIYEGDRYPS